MTTTMDQFTTSELLSVVAARELARVGTVFAGIGLPTLAVSLASRTCAPDVEIVYESGVCGAHPASLPETVADSVLVTGAEAVLDMTSLFNYVLQRGYIDVGFLGAAQIDRWGNLNSSVIGDWNHPKVRLPGPGGATEMMANSGEVYVVMRRHEARSFVRKLDFCTSPGPDRALEAGFSPRGLGVTKVITELGMLSRSAPGEELALSGVHRGVDPADVVAATGWNLTVSDQLTTIPTPSVEELRLLREEVDPNRIYLR